MKKYNHKKIDKKWQKKWEEEKLYKTQDDKSKPKFYCLDMFPYPSGAGLHIGHPKGYIATDVVARMKMMQGYNVLHPMGWDAFGLPTENYAIKNKIHPRIATEENINRFKSQLEKIGFTYDWSREINTTDPKFYKWTQWIFLEMFKRGLAYESYEPINWCPSCKTGLANEDLEGGKCERCGSEIERKPMRQWVLKITEYADRLLEDLDKLPEWEESIKEMQRNWIGRSEGAKLNFEIRIKNFDSNNNKVIGIGVLLKTKEGKLLLQKRDNNTKINPNVIAPFGGGLKEGESFKECAYREIKEELGIDIDKSKLIEIGHFESHIYKEKKIKMFYIDEISRKNLELQEGERIIEISIDEALKNKQVTDFTKEVLRKFKNLGIDVQSKFKIKNSKLSLEVFTTRPDTLFGCTYTVVAPEHPLIEQLKGEIKNYKEVEKYIKQAKKKSDLERTDLAKEKTGVKIDGLVAVNPVNNEEVPIFVADYVLAGYGTGAIMAVPAHDERDYEFAQKYGLPIKPVVLKSSEYSYSFLMGREKISEDDLKRTNIKIVEKTKDGFLKILIPNENIDEYKNLVREKMSCGFWNEFSTKNNFYFIFKHQDGKIEEFELNKNTNDIIDNYGMTFNNEEPNKTPENVYSWLAKNDFYKDLLIHTSEGVNINSGFLDGLPTKEAKEKMIEWLEEHKVGKRSVNYKLQNWVLSRQRYWGEPIPVIHCEACKNRKYNFILLHSFGGDAESNFFPWLKDELEKNGHSVFAPNLPNTNNPNISEQVDYVLANTKIDENTIIVGHSLGGVVAMRLLEKANKKVAKVMFVDSFIRPEFADATKPEVENSQNWDMDFNKIKSLADEFIVLADRDFTVIPRKQSLEMAKIFDARLAILKPNDWHFCGQEEPDVLRLLGLDGIYPVPEDELPVTLPEVKNYEPTGTGESPLANIKDWVNTTCPKCGAPARRETNTMPQWAGSSWYYLRYIDPHNDKALVDKDKEKYWSPIDLYVGGAEHATRHLIYARFWHKFLYDLGIVNYPEPFTRLHHVGLIMAEDGRKMSKRWGNVINPDDIVEKYGADALRVYEMFMGPFSQAVAWNTKGLVGVRRFLDKVWVLKNRIRNQESEIRNDKINRLLHKTIKKVTEDIENFKFNTAIAQMMILVNKMNEKNEINKEDFEVFLKLLAPFAPHLTEELWSNLGNKESIFREQWPKYNPEVIKDKTITLVIQVNGKVRDNIEAPVDITEEEVRELALSREKIKKWTADKKIIKVIFVKGRLVNIVVRY